MEQLRDSWGREIRSLRVSVTDKCNFRCRYCMPAEGLDWLQREEILSFEEIARVVREAGGTLYYDGANLNAVMGISRPGDMGFDIVHFNLHKSFTQPHGGGGPGRARSRCPTASSPTCRSPRW